MIWVKRTVLNHKIFTTVQGGVGGYSIWAHSGRIAGLLETIVGKYSIITLLTTSLFCANPLGRGLTKRNKWDTIIMFLISIIIVNKERSKNCKKSTGKYGYNDNDRNGFIP
jgi:hypothetical protein